VDFMFQLIESKKKLSFQKKYSTYTELLENCNSISYRNCRATYCDKTTSEMRGLSSSVQIG
jgi:hypothetical protein